jgi:hypothetical protein
MMNKEKWELMPNTFVSECKVCTDEVETWAEQFTVSYFDNKLGVVVDEDKDKYRCSACKTEVKYKELETEDIYY